MPLLGSILVISLLLFGAHATPLRQSQPVLTFTQLHSADSSLESSSDETSYDEDDSNVYVTYDQDSDKSRIYVTDEDSEVDEDKDYGTYEDSDATVVVEDEDSETMDELVNEYHSSGEGTESHEYSISGVEECDDCTEMKVPAGEYREYVEEVTTEYDEYYLVRVPVTRYDIYDIVQMPSTTHYVYYKSGDSEVIDQVTACTDCDDNESSDSDEDDTSDDDSCDDDSSYDDTSDDDDEDSSEEESSNSEKEVRSTESTYEEDDDEEYSTVSKSYREDSSSEVDSAEYCDVEDEVESVSVEEVDEYVVQEVEGGCEHCDLFIQDSYPQLSGDLYDNEETDSSYLTLVSPSESTQRVTWYEVNDTDNEDYEDDVEDSDNPVIPYTALLQGIDNALDRDEDDLPDDVDDEEEDAHSGELYWILVGSFKDDEAGSGKVYLVPEDDPEESTVLISGLDKPVGICFDGNYDFLYVVDPTFGDEGYIYQFSIDWDDDDNFNLASPEYVIVYQGANPYSCWVDEFSNLYFVDASDHSVNLISYLDLWSGFTNYYYTLYERDEDNKLINTPVGIAVYDSEDLYFVNNEVDEEAGVLNRAEAYTEGCNDSEIEQKVRGKVGAWALAVSEDYVHFISTDNSLWCLDRDDKTETEQRAKGLFMDARGICYGDGDIYVADFEAGKIYEFDDDDDNEESDDLDVWTAIENPYALYCVNW